MAAFACYASSPSPFGSVASAARSPCGSNPLPFGASGTDFGQNTNSSNIVSSPSPFGSNPAPFGCNAYTTNSSNTVSFAPSVFGSNRLTFGGNAFTAGTLCNTSLGSSQTFNYPSGGSSIASYRATYESDSRSMMQSISTMDIYANKSHEELRHEDYRMNNKGKPMPIFGSFGTPTSMFGFHQSSADLPTRNPFDLTTRNPSHRITPNPFSPSLASFSPPPPNYPFPVPSANFFAPRTQGFGFLTTTTTPSNAFYDATPTNPFSSSLAPFSQPKPSNPFSVPSANLFTPQTQGFGFRTTTPTPNNAFHDAPNLFPPSTNPFSPSLAPFSPPTPNNPFSVPSANVFTPQTQGFGFPTTTTTPTPAPASVPPPVGNINWGPFAIFAQKRSQNNVEAKIATPAVSRTPCTCSTTLGPCAPILNVSKPEVVSTTNPSQPSQASSGLTAVKEVGSQDTNGQQNISSSTVAVQPIVASTTQPETVVSVQNGSPSLPVETVLSVGMSSLSIGRSPTDTYEKGEAIENKARASFRVNVDCIDIDDVSSIIPKLPPGKEYYTEPSIEELEAKERAEPGFCSRVKDFVVGRKDKGSIKFLGETDVHELDLESIVQFNNREVVVYLDETKMPPVGQGLNKPAEVMLLNVKCISKLTGKQYNDGPQLRKYEEKLMEKTAEIGGEFVSFDPVRGQWKFRVLHF